jgi:hypothetical protein
MLCLEGWAPLGLIVYHRLQVNVPLWRGTLAQFYDGGLAARVTPEFLGARLRWRALWPSRLDLKTVYLS